MTEKQKQNTELFIAREGAFADDPILSVELPDNSVAILGNLETGALICQIPRMEDDDAPVPDGCILFLAVYTLMHEEDFRNKVVSEFFSRAPKPEEEEPAPDDS